MSEEIRDRWLVQVRHELAEDDAAIQTSDKRIDALSAMLASAHGGDASPTLRGWISRVEVVAQGDVFNLERAGAQGRKWIEGAIAAVGLPQCPVIELSVVNAKDFHSAMEVACGSLDVLGTAELAEVLKVSRQRVLQLRNSGALPDPDFDLAATPVWLRTTVEGFVWGWRRQPGPAPRDVDIDRLVSGQ